MVSNLTYVCDFVHESITKIVAILHEVVLKCSTTIIGNFNTMNEYSILIIEIFHNNTE